MSKPDVFGEIHRFVQGSDANRCAETGISWFDEPIVGYASAQDPIFREFKTIIGDFHHTAAN